ncbi:GNAT family N-acetyltransferase [Enteractinococcus coprophilus]|uniref:GNAT family N-acetyltransferase n=1 Tax=Enteractinococcus coprophilus TaxID=1027633 RepID=UPI00115326DC|nr:GNAT family N-acetyltransferase [Enteractinococcus coprophilus]
MFYAVPGFVYDNFYPQGWEARQMLDLGAVLDDDSDSVTVAEIDDLVVARISIRIHPEDKMGEIYVLCVPSEHQRQRLMNQDHQEIQDAGMSMVMVETGGDPEHEAARLGCETAEYHRWPVTRYFKEL